jgi:hypothetical protein
VRLVIGFGRFWWDFIVGDDWRIAAGVVASLGVGAVLVSATSLPDAALSILVTAAIIVVVTVSITGAARTARSSGRRAK